MSTSIFDFVEHEVKLLKQINLLLSLGEEPLRRTRTMIFIVVEADSAYNVILGRSEMSRFKAVTSTYHQKVKFPIDGQIREV